MTWGSKDLFINVSYMSNNIHHDVLRFEVDGIVGNIKNEYLKNRAWFFHENENIKLSLKNYILEVAIF